MDSDTGVPSSLFASTLAPKATSRSIIATSPFAAAWHRALAPLDASLVSTCASNAPRRQHAPPPPRASSLHPCPLFHRCGICRASPASRRGLTASSQLRAFPQQPRRRAACDLQRPTSRGVLQRRADSGSQQSARLRRPGGPLLVRLRP